MIQEGEGWFTHTSTELGSTGQKPKDCWAVEGAPGDPKAASIHVGAKSWQPHSCHVLYLNLSFSARPWLPFLKSLARQVHVDVQL